MPMLESVSNAIKASVRVLLESEPESSFNSPLQVISGKHIRTQTTFNTYTWDKKLSVLRSVSGTVLTTIF